MLETMKKTSSSISMNTINPRRWRQLMTLISTCKTMSHLKQIHARVITYGLTTNTYAISKLLFFTSLSTNGNLSYASTLFHHFHSPNSFFYNTLIRAYSRTPSPHLSLRYFNLMVGDTNVVPDQHTFPFVLTACATGLWVGEGRKIHNWVLKCGLGLSDEHVRTALLRFYCGCGEIRDARKVFDEMPERDVVDWTVIMNGYVKCGLVSGCLGLFEEMLGSGLEPDEFCVSTAISACAKLGSLSQGRWVHEYVERRRGLVLDGVVMTALVDMYAKCGSVDMALAVFERIPERNVQCWAALIGGFACNGCQSEAMMCLDRMQKEDGLMPDEVALLGVLSACTHTGSIDEGLFLLENMAAKYGVEPRHEHYSCVVDMLSKAGKLNEALEIIRRMPMKPLASVWGALLSGCRIHKNLELAELAVRELELLEGGKAEDGIYVELSNVYLASKKAEDASRIRKMIGERGMKKTRGCSAIEVNGKVNEFVAGDVVHPYLARIHETLSLVSFDLFRHSIEASLLEEGIA